MNRITHFEIPAKKPEASMKFFKNVFNWKFTKWENSNVDYWMVDTGDKKEVGINGGLYPRTKPEQIVVNTIDVADIETSIKKIKENGGTIATPKIAIPTVGWFAHFKDPDGNLFGVIQMDPKAK